MMTKIYTAVMSRLTTLKSKKGQTLVEYGLILALVAVVVIAVLTLLGNRLQEIFQEIVEALGGGGGGA